MHYWRAKMPASRWWGCLVSAKPWGGAGGADDEHRLQTPGSHYDHFEPILAMPLTVPPETAGIHCSSMGLGEVYPTTVVTIRARPEVVDLLRGNRVHSDRYSIVRWRRTCIGGLDQEWPSTGMDAEWCMDIRLAHSSIFNQWQIHA
jgi:hypothetical protein